MIKKHYSTTPVSTIYSRAFTLIETLVGVAVFLVVAMAAYQAYVSLFALVSASQYKVLAINLANEQFEIIRNLTYSDVGVVGGVPNGKVPYQQTLTRGGVPFLVTTVIRNIDLAQDGQIGSTTNDTSPADNRLVEVTVDCSTCKGFVPIVLSTNIAPKNLENSSTNGALFVKVFDANGQPIPGASVNVVNSSAIPAININDTTDANGMLQIVDVPPGNNAYAVSVTKSGYSSDRTYPVGGSGNPSPSKPDATVLAQQMTQVSFSIGKLSTVNYSTVTPTCAPVSGVTFIATSSKMIGTGVPKSMKTITTNASGVYSSNTVEWDGYTIGLNDATYNLAGLNPLNPVMVNPGSTQNAMIVVVPRSGNTLMVTVKDSATGLPLSGASVTLTGPASYSSTQTTGLGFLTQTDWSGGSGQSDFSNTKAYLIDDGHVDVTSSPGDAKLRLFFGAYDAAGTLESSTFDTGSVSNFYNLIRLPSDEPLATGTSSVRFQFATNATSTATTTWTYRGPGGATTTYYTSANSVIDPIHSGDRYARYKLYLSTASTSYTPTVSDVSFTFTSSCTPPGQVIFQSLALGSYTATVGKVGYATSTVTFNVDSNWKEQQITLSP
ncbi:prepilin-type N-terminal cleavage/methylation domain-containing protein [bacterium]|nr:prepilin-type N-terminal cleavage/methylation domain-containing protein [bacterium]